MNSNTLALHCPAEQLVASVWASVMLLEAVDLQTLCLSEVLQSQVCPVAMRPKPCPRVYNTNTAARQVAAEMHRATTELREAGSVMLYESCQEQQKTGVVSERRPKRGKDSNFVDDTSWNAYRVPLALAPSEICRRCGEFAISPDLEASIAARTFSSALL